MLCIFICNMHQLRYFAQFLPLDSFKHIFQSCHLLLLSTFDTTNAIMDHMGLTTLMVFRQAAKTVLHAVQSHINRRLSTAIAHAGIPSTILLQLLRESHSVISGSTSLHFMLPHDDRVWTPKDLDLYTNKSGYALVLSTLAQYGYTIHKVYTGYTSRHGQEDAAAEAFGFGVDRVINLQNECNGSIDVIVSTEDSPYIPIFNFHSTALMNFISGDGFFCAYPRLTSKGISVVNPLGFPGRDTPTARIQSCIQKYENRGFTYVYHSTSRRLCTFIGCFSNRCIEPIRHTQDKQCLYVQFACDDIGAMDGCLRTYAHKYNVKWCLGVKSCDPRKEDACPYVRVSRRL